MPLRRPQHRRRQSRQGRRLQICVQREGRIRRPPRRPRPSRFGGRVEKRRTALETGVSGVRDTWCSAMIHILFNGVGWTDIALTLNRIAVGLFFMLSGYHKLFNPERHRAFADELKGLGVHAVGFNQWWVPTVEFSAGCAVVIGFLAPLAALGLLFIILVAIVTSGRQRIKDYKPIDEADRIDD